MAAAPQQKFEAGVARVSELRTAATPAPVDRVNESWTALRTGIVAARKLGDVMDACPKEHMRHTLEFVLERGVQKKAARGQVKECLRILLARPPWLDFARADEGLCSGVCEALDSEHDAELIAQVAGKMEEAARPAAAGEEVAQVVEEDEAVRVAGEEEAAQLVEEEEEAMRVAGEEEAAAATEELAPLPKPLTIRERLAKGRAVLESFGWAFPLDRTGTRGDEATAGFLLILDVATALTTSRGRASVGGEPSVALADLEEDWSNLLQFLVGMYTSGVRKTYSERIRFVAATFRVLAPAFRELAPWASLPWGHMPMAAEEAESEAKAAEEIRRRQAEEEQNLALAQELQAQEDAAALALEEAQRQLVQEDLALACKLQEEGEKRMSEDGKSRAPAARTWLVQLPRMHRRRVAGGA